MNETVKPKGPTSNVTPSKLLPQNLEAEEAVLGSLLIDPDAIIRVATFLQPDDFYVQRNGWIYGAIRDLHEYLAGDKDAEQQRHEPDTALQIGETEIVTRHARYRV